MKRGGGAVVALVVAHGLAACADPEPETVSESAAVVPLQVSASAAPRKPAIDVRLGRETAFGLQLPRGSTARTTTSESRSFSVPLDRAKAVAFLTGRMSDVQIDQAPLQTTLVGTVIASSPRAQVMVVVRDTTLSSEVLVRLEGTVERTLDGDLERKPGD